jgi:replicative DNA helicase
MLAGGMRAGELIIVAGRPAMGKSALALGIATFVARSEKAVLIASYEMSRTQIGQRLLSSEAGINISVLRAGRGNLTDADWERLAQAGDSIVRLPIYVDVSPGQILQIKAVARSLAREAPLGLLVVDYLQLMPAAGKHDTREREIADISRSLKLLAKELDIPVVALSQLNRSLENRSDKRPIMADLRESGAIEQDADIILFCYRVSVYCEECKSQDRVCTKGHERDAEIIIAKQRQGETGVVKCHWRGETTQWLPEERRRTEELRYRSREVVLLKRGTNTSEEVVDDDF